MVARGEVQCLRCSDGGLDVSFLCEMFLGL